MGDVDRITVLFNLTKKEVFHPSTGYKKWSRKLRAQYKVETNKDEISSAVLKSSGTSLLVFGGPREMFTSPEFEVIKEFMANGGNVLVMLGEGGEAKFETNINYLIEEYGMSINNDSVVRTVYFKGAKAGANKFLHPKEALISTGITNREILRFAEKAGNKLDQVGEKNTLPFVYPYGATLNVQKPSIPILSTGHIAFPLNRPIGALFSHREGQGGRLCVLGSVHFFHDDYLEKEGNGQIMEFCMQWLTNAGSVTLNHIDAADPGINDYQQLPNTAVLAESVRSCLQECEDVPRDFTKMFDQALFKFDTNLIPEAIELYGKVRVEKKSLTLIQPQFEVPLPQLHPAVFPPVLREQPAPALDLMDLDEEFASDRIRLAHVTNKCSDSDLDYFVCQAGELLEVSRELPSDEAANPKAILFHIMEQLSNWKKLHVS